MREFKNILCVRADNMGDLIMSSPAIRALKETFGARITLLTSKMGSLISPFIPEIDEVVVANLPWVKSNEPVNRNVYRELVEKLFQGHYDLAVIFTVYSQNPLPAAMLAYEAGIPHALAYCRENPYHLLSDWVPEKEPYETIVHQVERDLKLVGSIGAKTRHTRLMLNDPNGVKQILQSKLQREGIDQPYLVLHPGVSERKRQYPVNYWIEVAKMLKDRYPVVISGSAGEQEQAAHIAHDAGVANLAGRLNVEEWLGLIANARAIVSVNTATIHIAAAYQKPVVVLYALTNPQHTPWQTRSAILPFSVQEDLRSNNQIVGYVNEMMPQEISYPLPEKVCHTLNRLLTNADEFPQNLLLSLQDRRN